MLLPIPVFAAGVWVGAKMFATEVDEYVLKPEKILEDDTFNTYFEHKPLVQEAYFAKLANRTVRRPGTGLYDLYVIERFRPALEKYAGGIADKTILELGPGENLATGLILIMAGAQKYYGLDIYRPTNFDSPGPYQSAIELMYAHPDLTKRSASGIFDVRDGKAALDPARIVYLYPHESYDIPLPDESMDLVFSHYSFEHFNEPQKTIDAIRRVLKPGGMSVHVVGMLDHRDFSKPYAYYTIDEATWRKEMLQPGKIQDFTNRWTASRFKKAFEESGFEIYDFVTEPDEISRTVLGAHAYAHAPITEEQKKTFAPEFQSYSLEDLSATYLFVTARKR